MNDVRSEASSVCLDGLACSWMHSKLARKEKIPEITTSLAWSAPLDSIGLPPRKDLQAMQPVQGWLAISELNIALGRDLSPEVQRWLDELLVGRPYRRVGKTIRLYYFE